MGARSRWTSSAPHGGNARWIGWGCNAKIEVAWRAACARAAGGTSDHRLFTGATAGPPSLKAVPCGARQPSGGRGGRTVGTPGYRTSALSA